MHNLRHFYYQNKEKIWKVILIVAFVLGIIYFIDSSVIERSNKKNTYISISNEIYSNDDNQTYISEQSAISGGIVSETEVNRINQTISKFLQYCKNGNSEEAYKMLSTDCKESEYKTLEQFENKYVKYKFSKNDVYEIQSWISNTYKIAISKDALATGEIYSDKKIEYITIVQEGIEQKLNINSYIGKKNLDKEITNNNVKITAINKNVYMDYEIYNFKIENLSNKTIKIDSLEKTGTMYLKDLNGNKYNALAHEIFSEDIEIRSQHEINISIKYANKYSDKVNINEVVFENVILDYIKYKKSTNPENFEEICEIKIEV